MCYFAFSKKSQLWKKCDFVCKKIGHDYQQYSVARKSIIDWCRCNCEPIKNESIVYAKPLILEEEDLFTLFVDPDALDNVIPLHQERFLSVIEEKDLNLEVSNEV